MTYEMTDEEARATSDIEYACRAVRFVLDIDRVDPVVFWALTYSRAEILGEGGLRKSARAKLLWILGAAAGEKNTEKENDLQAAITKLRAELWDLHRDIDEGRIRFSR